MFFSRCGESADCRHDASDRVPKDGDQGCCGCIAADGCRTMARVAKNECVGELCFDAAFVLITRVCYDCWSFFLCRVFHLNPRQSTCRSLTLLR